MTLRKYPKMKSNLSNMDLLESPKTGISSLQEEINHVIRSYFNDGAAINPRATPEQRAKLLSDMDELSLPFFSDCDSTDDLSEFDDVEEEDAPLSSPIYTHREFRDTTSLSKKEKKKDKKLRKAKKKFLKKLQKRDQSL